MLVRFASFALVLTLIACSEPSSSAAPRGDMRVPASPVDRCMNLGGALEAPNEGDWGYTIRAEDLQTIKAAGFDTVRLPVRWDVHAMQREPYTIRQGQIDRVREVIAQADAAGLQIIVDLHHYNDLMSRPDAHYERLFAMWRQIAEALQDAPDSVILELLNEPNDKMTVERTDAVNAELLSIVREYHPDRWVVVGSAGWGSLSALLESNPPEDDRIILTFHSYEPYDFTHQGAFFADPPPPTGTRWGTVAEYSEINAGAEAAARFASEQGHPMLLGEFGVYEDVPLEQRAVWTRAMRKAAEDRGIGWCYWDFATTFKAYNLERDEWIYSIKSALLDN